MAKKPKKRIAKKQAKMLEKRKRIQEAINFSTHKKQAYQPLNVETVIIRNAKDLINSTLPEEYTKAFNSLRDILNDKPNPDDYKWNWYWAAKKERDRKILQNIVASAVHRNGLQSVINTAYNLENSADDLVALADKIIHESGGKGEEELQTDIQTFINLILGSPMTAEQSRFVAENLEQIQKQTLEDVLLETENINPLTGGGVRKEIIWEPERGPGSDKFKIRK